MNEPCLLCHCPVELPENVVMRPVVCPCGCGYACLEIVGVACVNCFERIAAEVEKQCGQSAAS